MLASTDRTLPPPPSPLPAAKSLLYLPPQTSPSHLRTHSGHVLLYSLFDQSLHAFTVNHRHKQHPLASVSTGERLSAITFNTTGKLVLTAGEKVRGGGSEKLREGWSGGGGEMKTGGRR